MHKRQGCLRQVPCIAGIPELVARLQQQRKAVFLVSGGFHAIIDPIAQHLGIPAERVYANVILYKACIVLSGSTLSCSVPDSSMHAAGWCSRQLRRL